MHRRNVIDREADEKGEGPPSADGSASEDAVAGAAFKQEATTEEGEAECEADGAFACRAESAELIAEEEGETDDQRSDSEFVEPVLSEALLDRN